jgi:hypothetical protein
VLRPRIRNFTVINHSIPLRWLRNLPCHYQLLIRFARRLVVLQQTLVRHIRRPRVWPIIERAPAPHGVGVFRFPAGPSTTPRDESKIVGRSDLLDQIKQLAAVVRLGQSRNARRTHFPGAAQHVPLVPDALWRSVVMHCRPGIFTNSTERMRRACDDPGCGAPLRAAPHPENAKINVTILETYALTSVPVIDT